MTIFRTSIAALFALLFAGLGLLSVAALPAAAVDGADSAFSGLSAAARTGYGTAATAYTKPLPEVIGSVIGSALAFIGVIFFVLIVYGGFLWMTARGNDTQVGKAKDLIGAAIMGLIIVLMAYAITNYVATLLTASR